MTEEYPTTAWVHAMTKINPSNYFHETLIPKWTYWKNAKGILRNIGLGGQYDGGSFYNFNTKEVKECLGMLVLNGLIISPHVE